MFVSREKRIELIQKIEADRGSRLLVLFFGDRQQAETRIAPDCVPVVARQLRQIGPRAKIDVLLYTLGGDIMSGYRIVSLIREYCSERFGLLVPFKCQSTGTLIALGADEIVMLPESQLSPVDPSINGPYNPMIPGMPVGPGVPLPTLPVSVEEVVSYIEMAKDIGGLKGEVGLVHAFDKLTTDVRPLALGQVYRARTQIRKLSRKLLANHMNHDDPAVDTIVETLTEKLYSHDYLISRREAKEIGLKVTACDSALEPTIAELRAAYETNLEIGMPFNPIGLVSAAQASSGNQQVTVPVKLERAVIESSVGAEAFVTEQTLIPQPGGLQVIPSFEGWRTI